MCTGMNGMIPTGALNMGGLRTNELGADANEAIDVEVDKYPSLSVQLDDRRVWKL